MYLICQGETLADRRSSFPNNDGLSVPAYLALAQLNWTFSKGDRIWLAPDLAAQQTAAAMKLEGHTVPELVEPCYGHWAGLPVRQVMKADGVAFHNWLSGDAPPGGESLSGLILRTNEWLSGKTDKRKVNCVIASAAVIRAMITGLLEAPVSAFRRINVTPLSRTILTSNGAAWSLTISG